MEKAILVMDMPDSCAKCPFVLHEDEGWLYCGIHNSDTAYAFQRADYCPLKPMERIVDRLKVLKSEYSEEEKKARSSKCPSTANTYCLRAITIDVAIEIVKEELT